MKKSVSLVAVMLLLGVLFAQSAVASVNAEVFVKYDADKNGFLTIEEVKSNEDLADSFDDGDENGDGQLDMAEFEKMEVDDE